MWPKAFTRRHDVSPLQRLLAETEARHGRDAARRLRSTVDGRGRDAASPAGRAKNLFPELTARPWHETDAFHAATLLEKHACDIRRELDHALEAHEGFQAYKQDGGDFVPGALWQSMYFLFFDTLIEPNRALCPRTAAVLEDIDVQGLAMFSALLPGGHITPHCGPSNIRLTLHLGLVVPNQCAMRVGNETRTWEEGKCLVFDDSFEHEAWNSEEHPRIVLLADIWHPDLTAVEIEFFKRARRELAVSNRDEHLREVMADREAARNFDWWEPVALSGAPQSKL